MSAELQVTQATDDWRSEKPLFSSSDNHIEYIYGITPTLGNIVHRTCQISEALELCDRQHIPSSLQHARDVLQAELLTWSLETDDCHLANSGAGPLEIVSRQACAFHSAVLILYHRSIEPHPLINPQKEVLTVWENLTIAEQKKGYDTQNQKYGAPMSWPGLSRPVRLLTVSNGLGGGKPSNGIILEIFDDNGILFRKFEIWWRLGCVGGRHYIGLGNWSCRSEKCSPL